MALEMLRDSDANLFKEIKQIYLDINRQEIERKIREAKYKPRYKFLTTKELPEYFRNCQKDRSINLITTNN